MNFICFPNFSGKQQHFNIKLCIVFRGKSIFLNKINLKKVSKPFFLCGIQEMMQKHIFPHRLYVSMKAIH